MACSFVVTIGQAWRLDCVMVVRQGLAGRHSGRRGRSVRHP
jgi:hypothetical protein